MVPGSKTFESLPDFKIDVELAKEYHLHPVRDGDISIMQALFDIGYRGELF